MTATIKNKKQAVNNTATKAPNVILPYIRLQTKLAFTSEKRRGVKKNVVHYIIWALILALVCFFEYYFVKRFFNNNTILHPIDTPILLFTVADLFILIYCIVTQCRRIASPSDLNTILTFPMTRFQRYIGEIITILIKVTVYNFVIFYPIIMVYMGAGDYLEVKRAFTAMFSVLFMPLVPFAISLVLAIPFFFIHRAMKDKEVLKLVLFIVLFLCIIALYSVVLMLFADWWSKNLTGDRRMWTQLLKLFTDMNKWYNPAFYSSVIAINWKVGYCFLIMLGIIVVFTAIGMSACYPIYKRFTMADGNEGVAALKKVKYDGRNAYTATFVKDFKQTIRTSSYAYFFFGVAICMPILTLLSVEMIKKLAETKVGPETFFALALMVELVIISLIGSYSANTLSKEQSQFYMSKIAPVNTKKYLLMKSLVVFIVGFIVLLLCTLVLMVTSMRTPTPENQVVLTPTNIGILFATGLLFLVGICFNGLNLNLGRPAINLKGEPNESNVAIQLIIGVVLAIIIAEFALLASTYESKQSALLYVIVVAYAFAYALINFLVFWFTCNRRFNRIEVK